MELVDLEKVHEKDMYPVVEKFLKTQKQNILNPFNNID